MVTPVDSNIVSWVVFLPMFTALSLLGARVIASSIFNLDGLPSWSWRAIALLSSTITFVLAFVGLWQGFDPEITDYQMMERVGWMPSLGLNYFVGVDGISLVLVMLTTFVFPIAIVGSWKEVDQWLRSYSVFLLLLETGIIGALVSLNAIQLYFFWELTLISSFFILGRWGEADGLRAAVKSMVLGAAGFFLMLAATLVVYRLNLEQGGAGNFDLVRWIDVASPGFLDTRVPIGAAAGVTGDAGIDWWQTQSWLFFAFVLAFAVKIPLVPFHGWYNDAQCQGPTSGSVIVSALVLKLGIFAFLRIALPLFPHAAMEYAPWLCGLALAGIAISGVFALAQRDVKRLLGYISLAHMSFIVLGICSLEHHAVVGAVVHMLSHGLCISVLFILIGFLVERRSTRELSQFGGLARPMPICAALFAIAILGQVGVPGTSGFVGSFLVFLGSFPIGGFTTLLALAGMALVACGLMGAAGRMMLGPIEQPENRGLIDLNLRERLVALSLIVPILWVGLYPNPILRRIEPPVSLLLNGMARAVADAPAPVPDVKPVDRVVEKIDEKIDEKINQDVFQEKVQDILEEMDKEPVPAMEVRP